MTAKDQTTLPEPDVIDTHIESGYKIRGYKPDTVRRLIAEAEQRMKERCIQACLSLKGTINVNGSNGCYDECVAAIKELK